MPNLDEALHNADWTKQEWDLPDTLDGLLAAITPHGGDEEAALVRFLRLPAARAMPEGLRVEVEGLVASTVTFRSRNVLVTVPQRFHAGPGAHPGTGSPQTAHGGGGAGGVAGGWGFKDQIADRSATQVRAGMGKVESRFPKLTEGVQVELGPRSYGMANQSVMAWVRNDQGDVVSLSPLHADSADTAVLTSRKASRVGGLVTVPDGSHGWERYVVHEMAHIAEFRLGEKRLQGQLDAAFKRDHGVTLTALMQSADSASPSALAREAFGWSQYATYDVHEFIAEAFTDGILNEEPSKFAETVMGVIDSMYAEQFGGDE